uniref:ShKT domain-containing protein n=1 Tax=Angiostrongylus cantonensis TaxID=6313 RepID=A0A0K0DDB5_ANGCA
SCAIPNDIKNTDNSDFFLVPRVKCETVTKEQCNDPTWRTILTEDCPAVCGFCDQRNSNCTDIAVSCKRDLSICRNVDLQDFVKVRPSYQPYLNRSQIGVDKICSSWVRNGFCTNEFYTVEQKRRYCGKSCNLC